MENSIIRLLESTRVKERNEGLDRIEESLPGLFSRDVKEVIAVCNSLIHLIDYEKIQKDKNASSVTRLKRASNVLRNTIQASVTILPPRPSGYISLMNSMFRIIHHEIFIDLIKPLQLMLKQDYIKDHMNHDMWKSTCDFLISHINLLVPDGIFIYGEVLEAFNILFSTGTSIPTYIYELDFEEIITSFDTAIEHEAADSMIYMNILRLCNRFLMCLTSEHYHIFEDLTSIGFKILSQVRFNFKNTYDLNDEISIFMNQEAVYCELTSLIDSNSSRLSFLVTTIHKFIIEHLGELDAIAKPIFQQSIGLVINQDPNSWVKLNTIYLKDGDEPMWFFLLGFSKIIRCYYLLIREQKNITIPELVLRNHLSSNGFPNGKRRKVESILDYFNESHSEYEFLRCVINSSSSSKVQIIALQMLLMVLETFPIDIDSETSSPSATPEPTKENNTSLDELHWNSSLLISSNSFSTVLPNDSGIDHSIINTILTASNNKSLNFWAVIVLNSLFYNATRTEATISGKLIKKVLILAIPLVKVEQYSDLGCHLMYNVVGYLSLNQRGLQLSVDENLISQVRSVCDMADFSGPAFLNNPSIKFWIALGKLMKILGISQRSLAHNISNWFLSKWEQKFNIESPKFCWQFQSLAVYASWLSSKEVSFQYCPNELINRGGLSSLYYLSSRNSKLRQFIFDFDSRLLKTIPCIEIAILEPLPFDLTFNQVMSKFFDLRHLFHGVESIDLAMKYNRFRALVASLSTFEENRDMILKESLKIPPNLQLTSVSSLVSEGSVTVGVEYCANQIIHASIAINKELGGLNSAFVEDEIPSVLELYHGLNIHLQNNVQCIVELLNNNPNIAQVHQKVFFQWLESLRLVDLLIVLFEFSKIECLQKDIDLGKKGLTLLGQHGLNHVLIERHELMFTTLCRWLGNMMEVSRSTSIFTDILSWLLAAANKRIISTEFACTEYTKMILKTLSPFNSEYDTEYVDLQNRIGVKSVNDSFVTYFKMADEKTKFELLPEINSLFIKLNSNNKQMNFYKSLIESFESVSTKEDAGYCLFLASLSTNNFEITKSTIFNLFEIGVHETTHEIIKKCFDIVCLNLGVSDFLRLFDICKTSILKSWYLHYKLFENFPFSLLECDEEQLYSSNYTLIVSLVLASKSNNFPQVLQKAEDTDRKLNKNHIAALAFALAYVPGGSRNEVQKRLVDFNEQSLNKLLGRNLDLIVLECLRIVDTTDMYLAIKLDKSLQASHKYPNVSCVSSNLISMSCFLDIVNNLIKKFSGTKEEYWDKKRVYFFIRRLLRDLDFCITDFQKVLCVRRINLVIILSKQHDLTENSINNILLLHCLCLKCLPLCNSQSLSQDVLELFQLIDFQNFSANEASSKDEFCRVLVKILSIVVDKLGGKDINNYTKILEMILDIPSPLENITKMVYNILSGSSSENHTELDITLLLEFGKDDCEAVLKICSFLSETIKLKWKDFSKLHQLLWKTSTENLNERFKVLCANSLAQYYMTLGMEIEEELLNKVYEFDDIEDSDYLKQIIRLLLRYQKLTSNYEIANLADFAVGVLIRHEKNLIGEVDDMVLSFVIPWSESLVSYFFDEFQTQNQKWIEKNVWGLDLFQYLLGHLPKEDHESLKVIGMLGRCSTDFVQEVLPYLVCYFLSLQNENNKVIKWINSFSCKTSMHSKDSCKVILKSVFLIRKEARRGSSIFQKHYDLLDLEIMSKMAVNYDFYKAGLMLFEDKHFRNLNNHKKQLKPWYKYEYVIKIFESIDSEDLMNGLPRKTTLDKALGSIWQDKGHHSTERMKFEFGKFESNWMLDSTSSSNDLVLSMLNSGLVSASRVIGTNYANADPSTESSYEWAWKLNDWSLPPARKPTTQHELIYNSLKLIKDYTKDAMGIVPHCNRELERNLIRSFDRKDTLKDINDYGGLHKNFTEFYSSLNILSHITKIYNERDYKFDEHGTKDLSFDKLDTFMLSRIMLHNVLNINSKQKKALLISDLAKYNNISIENHKGQQSVNTIMLMNEIIKGTDPQEVHTFVGRYHIAKGMWHQGYSNVAIPMMLELKEDLESSNIVFQTQKDLEDDHSGINNLIVDANLVEWLSASKQEYPTIIMDNYFQDPAKWITNSSPRLVSECFVKLGRFCEAQYRSGDINNQITKMERHVHSKRKELDDIKSHYSKISVPTQEKKTVQKYYTKLKLQFTSESKDHKLLMEVKNKFLVKSVECYLISIFQTDNFEIVDRFFSLWFEESKVNNLNELINSKFKSEMINNPQKFVGWISQLVSRLSDEPKSDIFQNLVQNLIFEICIKFPFLSLYHLISLKENAAHVQADDEVMVSKIKAATKVYNTLRSSSPGSYFEKVFEPVQNFCTESILLSKHKLARGKTMDLRKNSKINGNFWLNLPAIPPPTLALSLQNLNDPPVFESMDPIVSIASSGLSLPKIAKFRLSNGKEIRILFKHGTDDLRQDAIMQQVFEKVNQIFNTNKESVKRNLQIRTYKIVPLGPNSGIIEFVSNSMALIEIIKPYHEKYDKIDISKARELMKECQNQERFQRINVFKQEIVPKVSPVLHNFFFDHFLTPKSWFRSRLSYSHGLATSSIVGHILGLGDRHCNNILLDKSTGEPIHIDLGVAFDQGSRLPIPETVPFRLTKDLVDGLGLTGVDGPFRTTCEVTHSILRENQDHIISILNILKWDPLYSWTLSPLRKKKIQHVEDKDNPVEKEESDVSEAGQAILVVRDKLQANGLSSETVIRDLINQATSPENLALLFCGWCPFY